MWVKQNNQSVTENNLNINSDESWTKQITDAVVKLKIQGTAKNDNDWKGGGGEEHCADLK